MGQRAQSGGHTTKELLLSVARCSEITRALNDRSHPCHKVVSVQNQRSLQGFQLPEPWNGSIDQVPLLFVSSNPSYAPHEMYPNGDEQEWPDDLIVDFFTNRFGGGRREWIRNGNRAQQVDGTFGEGKGHTVFWPRTKSIVADLFDREVIAGRDYAITEVVHCKSLNATGVPEAGNHCTALHLGRILRVSPASVIVVLGVKPNPYFKKCFRRRENRSWKRMAPPNSLPLSASLGEYDMCSFIGIQAPTSATSVNG